MSKKILLIDGNSLFYRAYFGSIYGNSGIAMSTSKGVPTNAIYAFARMLKNILTNTEYFDVKVAFDKGKHTFRHDLLPDYKGGRNATPEDLKQQFPIVKEFLTMANIQYLEKDNIEADDLIGTMALKAEAEGFQVDVLSSDQDMYQLISDNIFVIAPRKGISDLVTYNDEMLMDKWGVKPNQVVDYKGLNGDPSDNIKGVEGVGKVTAAKLLAEHPHLEDIYENIDNIKGALQKKLIAGKEDAFLSRKIATIKTDVVIEEGCEFAPYNINKEGLNDFYTKYEMTSLMDNGVQKAKIQEIHYQTVKKFEESFFSKVNYLYLECIDTNYHTSEIIGMALTNDVNTYVLATSNAEQKSIFDDVEEEVIDAALQKALLSDIKFATYDAKKTIYALRRLGYEVKYDNFVDDLMIAGYVLNANVKSTFEHHIKFLEPNEPFESDEAIFGKGVKRTTNIDKNIKNKYLAHRSMLLKEFLPVANKLIDDNNQTDLYKKIEIPFSFVLLDMEWAGVLIDKDELKTQTLLVEKLVNEQEFKVKNYVSDQVDENFNVGSPKQVKELLYDKLQLPNHSKGSTDRETLEQLSAYSPVPQMILEYRKYQKLYSTYLLGFEKYIYKDKKVHTIFNQTLTNTGRLSSADPNLQNISVRDELQRNVRKIFKTDNDRTFLSYDYSQIELRVLADIADERVLIETFKNDQDIHETSARKIFHLNETEEVTSEQRRMAKVFNFGIIYGLTDFGLSKDLKISIPEAKKYIDQYFASFPGIKTFIDKSIEEAKEFGYVVTEGDRRRYIPELNSPQSLVRKFGERIAVNSKVQGTAADILKVAMINIYEEFKTKGIKSEIVAQIHDEIIVNTLSSELDVVDEIIQRQMKSAFNDLFKLVNKDRTAKVKLDLSKNEGKTWFDLK